MRSSTVLGLALQLVFLGRIFRTIFTDIATFLVTHRLIDKDWS
jgi:hypothetical protein